MSNTPKVAARTIPMAQRKLMFLGIQYSVDKTRLRVSIASLSFNH